MTELFYMGGPLFMGILTIVLIAVIATAAIYIYRIKSSQNVNIALVKEIGLFGLIVGILGQFLGLYQAFTVIEVSGTVSPEILMSGLKISSITTIYGLIICLIGYLLYFGLRAAFEKSDVEKVV
ncbi:MAG: MotA/TolQ/ExbB proton channel family protein [Balneolaceae bacterium]|nr:MotA/TolQ/ExbB proton channel family protein [Balneolaceae bacterium]MCH8547387.1 MotA/TolQ/ExbB proton channel family protein [Balneolaceae bacterium]